MSVSHWVPGLARLLATVARRGGSPVTEQFQNVQLDRIQQVCLPGLPDNGQEELQLSHEPLLHLKPGVRSVGLLPQAWVCMTPPSYLGRLCWWQDQSETVLKLNLQEDRAVSGPTARTIVSGHLGTLLF